MKKTIRINRTDSIFLAVSLSDVLSQIENGTEYSWNILWVEAIGKLERKTMLEFEEKINNSKDGYALIWEELVELADSFSQVINILLVGDKDKDNLKRYDSDDEMRIKCSFCIELIDSSYWEITSNDLTSIEKLMLNIPGSTMF